MTPLGAPPPVITAALGLPEWADRLGLAGLILLAAILLLWLVSGLMGRLGHRAAAVEGHRGRQRQTAISALATALRYAVLVVAGLALAIALAGGGGVGAVGGGALAVVVLGFASQRLLFDVIAGFFILFEDQYGVGDVVRLEPTGYIGRVESLGLRATVLESGGERMIVPNGQITAVRTFPEGRRRYRVEFLTRDPEEVQRAITDVAGAVAGAGGPWDAPPRVVRREGSDGLVRMIAVVDVDPVQGDALTTWFPAAVAERAGEALASPPLVTADRGRTPVAGPS